MSRIEEIGLYNYLVENKYPDLRKKAKLINLKKGQQLYSTSQRFTDIYEIICGAVKLGGISGKGEEYIYELVTPGGFFGNLALLNDDIFCEFCRTLTATQVRSYEPDFFRHLITHDPQVAAWFYSKIVYRWNKTESMLANIRSYEPRERIQRVYTSLQRKVMTATSNREALLSKLVTYKDIADLTATTRQLVADTITIK